MKKFVYFDNAATTPPDKTAVERMICYLQESYGNADSPHAAGRKAMVAVDSARETVANALGAKFSEIYFTSGGTESDNWAILGGARAKRKDGRTHVLISSIEHHAALFAAETLAKEGFEVEYIPVNEGGRVALNEIKRLLRPTTALVCVMRVNNETGVVQPIGEIGRLTKENGCLFFVDAVQAFPHEKIDVKAWGVDLLSVSSHKLHGPKGCGALYIRSGVKMEKLVGGGEQERGLRGGTLNVPAIVGFAAAVERTVAEYSAANARLAEIKEKFLQGISELDGITVNGDGEISPAVLSLRVQGVDNATLLYKADLQGLCIAAGSACASASVKPSHVLTAMGRTEREAKETVRISFGRQNTVEEGEQAAKIFVEVVKSLRKNEKSVL